MYVPAMFEEKAPGFYERKIKGNPVGEEVSTRYLEREITIFQSDLIHYTKQSQVFEKVVPDLKHTYRHVTAVGGGSPKFEVMILGAEDILILDGLSELYKGFDATFREIYNVNDAVKITYQQQMLAKPFKVSVPADGCISFIHFLEHCDCWENVCEWIRLQESDVVIYNPNISAAQGDDWGFFNCPDHNVFFTIEAISREARKAGFLVRSQAYCDDMLIWMRRPENFLKNPPSAFTERERTYMSIFNTQETLIEIRRVIRELLPVFASNDDCNRTELLNLKFFPLLTRISDAFDDFKTNYDFFNDELKTYWGDNIKYLDNTYAELAVLLEHNDGLAIRQLLHDNVLEFVKNLSASLKEFQENIMTSEKSVMESISPKK